MTTIRIETVDDAASGLVRAEIFLDDRQVLKSEAAFGSHDELADEIISMCRTRFPDHMPFVEDPTIGV